MEPICLPAAAAGLGIPAERESCLSGWGRQTTAECAACGCCMQAPKGSRSRKRSAWSSFRWRWAARCLRPTSSGHWTSLPWRRSKSGRAREGEALFATFGTTFAKKSLAEELVEAVKASRREVHNLAAGDSCALAAKVVGPKKDSTGRGQSSRVVFRATEDKCGKGCTFQKHREEGGTQFVRLELGQMMALDPELQQKVSSAARFGGPGVGS